MNRTLGLFQAPIQLTKKVRKPLLPKSMAATAISYEDKNILIANKPSSVAIQGRYGSYDRLAWDNLLQELTSRPSSPELYPIHRLDKSTTGNLIFAKSAGQAKKLSQHFRNKEIKKEYLAVVHGAFKEGYKGVIDTRLRVGEDRVRSVKVEEGDEANDGVEAKTEWECLAGSSEHSLLQLTPIHGRKHQLRIHCAESLKAPIVGDFKYGIDAPHRQLLDFPHNTMLLHSYRTSLYTWSKQGKRSTIEAFSDPPDIFKKFCLLAGLSLPSRPLFS